MTNYDDVDLGIVAIVCMVAVGTAGAIVLVHLKLLEHLSTALAFVATGITAVAALARGRNGGEKNETPPQP